MNKHQHKIYVNIDESDEEYSYDVVCLTAVQ